MRRTDEEKKIREIAWKYQEAGLDVCVFGIKTERPVDFSVSGGLILETGRITSVTYVVLLPKEDRWQLGLQVGVQVFDSETDRLITSVALSPSEICFVIY